MSVIQPGDPGYESLMAQYQGQKGGPVEYAGHTYAAINDSGPEGDFIKFARTGSVGTLDKMYGSRVYQPKDHSVPMTQSGPLETAPRKPTKRRRSAKNK